VTGACSRPLRAALLLLALSPAPAQAHLVETGFGAFYDGLAHVLMTPADLLVVLALALLAGLRGPLPARWALWALPAAWLLGAVVGMRLPSPPDLPVLTTLSFAAIGALVVFDAKLRAAAVTALAIAAGLIHGFVNGATMAPAGATATAVAGAVTAVFCLLTIVAAEVTRLQAGWTRVAVRVVGSWIAAAGLLMLGWLARPGV
jgi:urease accessory protein